MKKFILFVYLTLGAVSIFAEEMSISAKLSVPEITSDAVIVTVEVKYLIPPNMYQSYNKDFFYFTVEGIEGMVQDVTNYHEGKIKDGGIIYFGETVLSSVLHIPADLSSGSYNLSIIAAYQLCGVNSMCYFPEEEEILMEIEL